MPTKIQIPVLLLERDGYEVETVLVGPHAKYTAWVLLKRRQRGGITVAASGWTERYEDACSEAYAAYEQHKRMTAARDGAAS